jgi:chromosome segregation ATPase
MLKTISLIMIAASIGIAIMQYHEAASAEQLAWDNVSTDMSYPELEKYKEYMEDTVSQLKTELSGKEEELTALDKELIELESEYNRLLEESQKLSERLSSITAAENDQ